MNEVLDKEIWYASQHDIERPCVRNGRPSFKWVRGYYLKNEQGHRLYPSVTKKEARAESASRGKRAVFRG